MHVLNNFPRAGEADGFSVFGGAEAGAGRVKFITGGIEDAPQNRTVVLDQCRRDGKFRFVFDEGTGAVNRVNNPGFAGMKAVCIVLRLLRQPAIMPPVGHESVLQQIIDGDVGFSDRLVFILVPAFWVGPVIAHGQCPGLPDRFPAKGQNPLPMSGHRPARDISSISRLGALTPRRNVRSDAGVMVRNISFRLPAMVISLTG